MERREGEWQEEQAWLKEQKKEREQEQKRWGGQCHEAYSGCMCVLDRQPAEATALSAGWLNARVKEASEGTEMQSSFCSAALL